MSLENNNASSYLTLFTGAMLGLIGLIIAT